VQGRPGGFDRADEALQLAIDYLGQELAIDSSLLPPPYCYFALTDAEAQRLLTGLEAFARRDVEGDDAEPVVAAAPPNPHDVVQPGSQHSWTDANDFFEAVMRRLAGHATRGDVLGLFQQATGKEFYELSADELYQHAADVDRLGKSPTILKQAIDRMRIARGG
jgi:hypothetical protein